MVLISYWEALARLKTCNQEHMVQEWKLALLYFFGPLDPRRREQVHYSSLKKFHFSVIPDFGGSTS